MSALDTVVSEASQHTNACAICRSLDNACDCGGDLKDRAIAELASLKASSPRSPGAEAGRAEAIESIAVHFDRSAKDYHERMLRVPDDDIRAIRVYQELEATELGIAMRIRGLALASKDRP